MKNMIKSLLVAGLVGLGATLNTQAVTIVATVAAGTAWNATNIISGSARITAITIAQSGNSATNLTFALVDVPTVPQTDKGWYYLGLSNGAYTTFSSYVTNILRIQTNFGGVYTNADGTTNWITMSNVLWSYRTTNGATTNGWRVLASGTVASNGGSTTLTLPSTGIPVIFGLGLTNNNAGVGLTLTITYSPSL